MRKFIIKNRTKRKYTKKADQHSSILFSKTFFNILPLLIMIIALMTTLVISSPTRMPLSNIHFTLSMPTFTWQNPLPFLQTQGYNVFQLGITIGTSITGIYATVIAAIGTYLETSMKLLTSFDPTPFVTLIESGRQSISTAANSLYSVLINILTLFVGFVIWAVRTIIFNYIHNISAILQFLYDTILIVSYAVVQVTRMIASNVSSFAFFIYHVLSVLIASIANWIWSLFGAISLWFKHTTQAIASLISWPFKIVIAYFMQFKPLTDTLGKHFEIALNDSSACFTNFGKTLQALGTSK